MPIEIRKAGAQDAALLTNLRRTVLIAANQLPQDADLSAIEAPCLVYFSDEERQSTYLAWEGNQVVGVGSVDYHTEMPTSSNPTGKCAFLMNIYTDPAYRRQGIGARIVEKLIQDAKERGVSSILLEATEMGVPLYSRMGFVPAQGYMRLNLG